MVIPAGARINMETQIEKITHDPELDKKIYERAGKILRAGGLVAFPTETVYGLGGNASDPEAAKAIYKAKGRPSDNPLIVHIAKRSDLRSLAEDVTEKAEKLMDRYWPGPITFILKRKTGVPDEVTGGLDTVAVRMPAHPVARKLIEISGVFIAAPSANLSGRPSPTRVGHVIEDLSGRIDMIIEDDSVDIGLESTIVDCSVDPPVLLRPGNVTPEDIRALIGDLLISEAVAGAVMVNGDTPRAPGMKYRHYAPEAPLIIVKGRPDAVVDKINEMTEKDKQAGKKTAVMATDENKDRYSADIVISLGPGKNYRQIGEKLFAALREMDKYKVQSIYSESFETDRLGLAIMNRLLKASDNNIISV